MTRRKLDLRRAFHLRFVRSLYVQFDRNQLVDVAGQLAFSSLFSLFPFLIFLATVFAYLPLRDTFQSLLGLVGRIAPPQVFPLLTGPLASVAQRHGTLLWVSIFVAIYSASSGTMSLMSALNRAYGAREERSWWWRRLVLAPLVTVIVLVLVIVAAFTLLLGPTVGHAVANRLELGFVFDLGWSVARWILAISMPMMALAVAYYALPAIKLPFRFITPGSVIATGLWIAGSLGFRVYVARFGRFDATFGSLAGGAVLLMWLYLSSVIVLLGGEINAMLAPPSRAPDAEPTVQKRDPTGKPASDAPGPRQPAPA